MIKVRTLDERYARIVDRLTKVEDPETKAHVIELIENGFAPFDLATLGQRRNLRNSPEDLTVPGQLGQTLAQAQQGVSRT